MSTQRSSAWSAYILGLALGATTTAGATLLLYTTRGFLAAAGLLFALTFAALGLGLWVSGGSGVLRRRLVLAAVAYLAAAGFAALWSGEPALRRASFGGAFAVLFLLAEPAYTIGAAFASLPRTRSNPAPFGFLGAGIGVLAAALFLIPRLQASVIFLCAAVVLIAVALIETRRAIRIMTPIDFSFADKAAIVTGVGDRGQLGYAIAQAFADAGARVCVSGLSDAIRTLAAEIGPHVVAVEADLTNEAEVARLIATAHDRFGRIDIVVNVAGGLSVIKPIAETSAADWQRELARNAETAFLVSRTALPHLRDARGSIINFASPAGIRAVAGLGAYSAAKAAVVAFTRALAIEEREHGVRVNAIAPGAIDTVQNRRSAADPSSEKWVTRAQVAQVVMFLASEAATGVTGETMHVLGEGVQ